MNLWRRLLDRIAPQMPPERSQLDLWDATGRPRDEAMERLLDKAQTATRERSNRKP